MIAVRNNLAINLRIALSFTFVFVLACLSLLYVSGSSIDDFDNELLRDDHRGSWSRFFSPSYDGEDVPQAPQQQPPSLAFGPSRRPSHPHATSSKPPSDTIPQRKLRIIHFIDYDTYYSVTDRWFLHSASAFSQSFASNQIAQSELWGPGFPDWIVEKSISENIAAKYGSADHFDAAMLYFNTDQLRTRRKLISVYESLTQAGADASKIPTVHKWFYYEPWVKELNEWSRAGKGTILIDRPHELRESRRVEFYTGTNVTLILAPYPGELFAYRKPFGEKALLVHQPHFVDPEVFYQPIDAPARVSRAQIPRNIDFLIAGAIIPDWYPFRRRIAVMAAEKKFPSGVNVVVREHPGYGDLAPPEKKKAITSDSQEDQLKQFSKQMGQSKICLVTSSRWGYSVQKYIEAASAGCLIMGNVPIDRTALWAEHIVEIGNKDTDEHIHKTIQHWLHPDQDVARLEKVRKAQQWVLENFSTKKYVQEVARHIRAAMEGQKGMVLPWEWQPERVGTLEELPMDG